MVSCIDIYCGSTKPGVDNPLWASFQICKIAGCACAGNAGKVFPANGGLAIPTYITARVWRTHRDACRDTNVFLWSRWRGKRSRHSRRMRNPKFYVSGKRPMARLPGIKCLQPAFMYQSVYPGTAHVNVPAISLVGLLGEVFKKHGIGPNHSLDSILSNLQPKTAVRRGYLHTFDGCTR